jgi:putative flippase GtrA
VSEMALSSPRLLELRAQYGQKAGRYVAVSIFNVIFGQALLVMARVGFEWSFAWSNMFAVTVSAGPAYVLSRRWIWQKTGHNHFLKEVVPFWSMGFAGLALSTLFAWQAEQLSDATVVLMGANLSAFGILWVAKFVILDKVLFVTHEEPLTDDALDALVDEVLHHHEKHAEASSPAPTGPTERSISPRDLAGRGGTAGSDDPREP